MKPIKIIYNGVEYASITKFAKSIGVTASCISRRLIIINNDYSRIDEIVDSVRTVKDHLGNKYKTQKELLRKYGLARTTFFNRINNGWNLEKALTTPTRDTQRKITVNGKTFNSLKELSSFYGASYSSVRRRLSDGWKVEDVALQPDLRSVSKEGKLLIYNGKSYKSITALSRDTGAIPEKIYYYYRKFGKDPDKIEEVMINALHKPVYKDHKGNTYKTIAEMASAYNMQTGTLQSRLENMPIEEALTRPVIKRNRKNINKKGDK